MKALSMVRVKMIRYKFNGERIKYMFLRTFTKSFISDRTIYIPNIHAGWVSDTSSLDKNIKMENIRMFLKGGIENQGKY